MFYALGKAFLPQTAAVKIYPLNMHNLRNLVSQKTMYCCVKSGNWFSKVLSENFRYNPGGLSKTFISAKPLGRKSIHELKVGIRQGIFT